METRYYLKAVARAHPGQHREINQDNVMAFIRSEKLGEAMGLFVVADGMGGHKAGEVASKLAVDTIRQSLSWMLDRNDVEATQVTPAQGTPDESEALLDFLKRRLQLAIKEANQVIFTYARENPVDAGNLGCTVTCAMVIDNMAAIANVGDSRTYRLSDGALSQITDDHSYVWQLTKEGHLKEEEIYDHPQRNVITRALGNKPEIEVDSYSLELELGDRLLLCSDGVWEMIRSPEEIQSLLQQEDIDAAVDGLIQAANDYGGLDNIGVVVAELVDQSPSE